MVATIKGYAPCPECGAEQPVMDDTRKLYIRCDECRTYTNYQSKAAKERILNRLTAHETQTEDAKEAIENDPPSRETLPKSEGEPITPSPEPRRGLLASLDELFSHVL